MTDKNKKHSRKKAFHESKASLWVKTASLTILSIFFVSIIFFVHPFGRPEAVEMDDYFIKNAQRQTGSNNVVSGIVFDYRGLDTLGEATILFAAVLGISLISIRKKFFIDR